ncbi:hypothetical protein DCAR_0417367 [Daucus carota subsp. sativus]|uniref:Uncharacterized protein n=1 Tax=Daucus carota subsp. sativus TaxID=79200 RepID=A0A165YD42_DAUCS|nr:hypothetical protein DCAR_0417367 [Daucus carota subsp. sativus]
MGKGRTWACFSLLLLLMLLQIQIATCCRHEDDKRFKVEAQADSKMTSSPAADGDNHVDINGVLFVEGNPCYKDGDDIYDADERRINTGANPLHNR